MDDASNIFVTSYESMVLVLISEARVYKKGLQQHSAEDFVKQNWNENIITIFARSVLPVYAIASITSFFYQFYGNGNGLLQV